MNISLRWQITNTYGDPVPKHKDRKPHTVEIEAFGYEGQGITLLEIQNRDATLMPHAILATAGQVSTPEALLRDDSLWAFLGDRRYDLTVHEPERADVRSVVRINLK